MLVASHLILCLLSVFTFFSYASVTLLYCLYPINICMFLTIFWLLDSLCISIVFIYDLIWFDLKWQWFSVCLYYTFWFGNRRMPCHKMPLVSPASPSLVALNWLKEWFIIEMFYAWRLGKRKLVLNPNKLCVKFWTGRRLVNSFFFIPVISSLKTPYEVV